MWLTLSLLAWCDLELSLYSVGLLKALWEACGQALLVRGSWGPLRVGLHPSIAPNIEGLSGRPSSSPPTSVANSLCGWGGCQLSLWLNKALWEACDQAQLVRGSWGPLRVGSHPSIAPTTEGLSGRPSSWPHTSVVILSLCGGSGVILSHTQESVELM